MGNQHVSLSKHLSFVLRHQPASIGLTLDEHGWASIDELIRCMAEHGRPLDRALLEEIVANSDKQRFAISPDGRAIRANQGHSIDIELGLPPRTPPERLYHGTATRFLDAIRASGLRSQSRQHVHLSADRETAERVGSRHGKPVVLVVDSGRMARDGKSFYCSDNGVWLTAEVGVEYLEGF